MINDSTPGLCVISCEHKMPKQLLNCVAHVKEKLQVDGIQELK